jgi:hypothetical protein
VAFAAAGCACDIPLFVYQGEHFAEVVFIHLQTLCRQLPEDIS